MPKSKSKKTAANNPPSRKYPTLAVTKERLESLKESVLASISYLEEVSQNDEFAKAERIVLEEQRIINKLDSYIEKIDANAVSYSEKDAYFDLVHAELALNNIATVASDIIDDQERALFKMDVKIKKNAKGEVVENVRVEKVIAEAFAFDAMALMGIEESEYAKVELVQVSENEKNPFPGYQLEGAKSGGANATAKQGGVYAKISGSQSQNNSSDYPVDEKGNQTYIKSTFLPLNKGDLWQAAYEDYKLESLIQIIENSPVEKIQDVLATLFRAEEASAAGNFIRSTTNEGLKKLNLTNENKQALLAPYIIDLSKMATKNQHFVSGVGNTKIAAILKYKKLMKNPRIYFRAIGRADKIQKRVDDYLQKDPERLRSFLKMLTARDMEKDAGTHKGNWIVDAFGNVKAIDGGTGGYRIDVRPQLFSPYNTANKMYKNFRLEYDKNIIAGEEAANVYMAAGKIEAEAYRNQIRNSMEQKLYAGEGDILNRKLIYGVEPLQKYARHLGMSEPEIKAEPLEDAIVDLELDQIENKKAEVLLGKIIDFRVLHGMKNAQAIAEQGYALALEHCFNPKTGVLDIQKYNQFKAENPGFETFVKNEENIRNMQIVFHTDLKKKNNLAILHWGVKTAGGLLNKLNLAEKDNPFLVKTLAHEEKVRSKLLTAVRVVLNPKEEQTLDIELDPPAIAPQEPKLETQSETVMERFLAQTGGMTVVLPEEKEEKIQSFLRSQRSAFSRPESESPATIELNSAEATKKNSNQGEVVLLSKIKTRNLLHVPVTKKVAAAITEDKLTCYNARNIKKFDVKANLQTALIHIEALRTQAIKNGMQPEALNKLPLNFSGNWPKNYLVAVEVVCKEKGYVCNTNLKVTEKELAKYTDAYNKNIESIQGQVAVESSAKKSVENANDEVAEATRLAEKTVNKTPNEIAAERFISTFDQHNLEHMPEAEKAKLRIVAIIVQIIAEGNPTVNGQPPDKDYHVVDYLIHGGRLKMQYADDVDPADKKWLNDFIKSTAYPRVAATHATKFEAKMNTYRDVKVKPLTAFAKGATRLLVGKPLHYGLDFLPGRYNEKFLDHAGKVQTLNESMAGKLIHGYINFSSDGNSFQFGGEGSKPGATNVFSAEKHGISGHTPEHGPLGGNNLTNLERKVVRNDKGEFDHYAAPFITSETEGKNAKYNWNSVTIDSALIKQIRSKYENQAGLPYADVQKMLTAPPKNSEVVVDVEARQAAMQEYRENYKNKTLTNASHPAPDNSSALETKSIPTDDESTSTTSPRQR